jgi:ABC-type multidrug transport system fused ATPase/permease subunit
MLKKINFSYISEIFYNCFLELKKKEKYKFFIGFSILIVGCMLSALVQVVFRNIVNNITVNDSNICYIGMILLFLMYSFLWTINQISNIVAWLVVQPVLAKLSENIILQMFLHTLHIEYHFFLTKDSKSINSYFETIFNTIYQILSHLIIHIIPSLIEMIIVFVFFFYVYGYFYSFILLFLLLLFFYFTYNSIINSKKLDTLYYNYLDKFYRHILQSISHIEVIKTYGGYEFEYEKMRIILSDFFSISIKRTFQLDKAQAYQIITCGVILLIISLITFFQMANKQISIGDFVLLNNYFIQFTIPITFLGYIFAELYKNFILLKKSFSILNKNEDIDNLVFLFNKKFVPSIVFKDIVLEFDDEKRILDDISFEIKPREKIAIIGASGSGKSSCLKLIMKLYSAKRGNIFISDQNIDSISNQELYKYIAIVPQQSYVFGGSIRDNIKYNQKNITDDQIMLILKKIKLYDKINSLEQGLDTLLENIDFSGGEKQRISIARALVRDPEIFLFDEITASLDTKIEADIKEYLDEILVDKTVIFVTHRLLFAKNADKIILLKNGKIKEIGIHEELIRNSKEYQKLYNEQCGI